MIKKLVSGLLAAAMVLTPAVVTPATYASDFICESVWHEEVIYIPDGQPSEFIEVRMGYYRGVVGLWKWDPITRYAYYQGRLYTSGCA